jgi:hypothetical protein
VGKRRADADYRRFFDEFECVKIPRLRASGVVQLDAPHERAIDVWPQKRAAPAFFSQSSVLSRQSSASGEAEAR